MQHSDLSAVDKDNWFSTGDVASIDPLGYMRITDRSKDVIKSGGEWISSIEIENMAVSHEQVCVTAKPVLRRTVTDLLMHHLDQHLGRTGMYVLDTPGSVCSCGAPTEYRQHSTTATHGYGCHACDANNLYRGAHDRLLWEDKTCLA